MGSKDYDRPMHQIQRVVQAQDTQMGQPNRLDDLADSIRDHGVQEPIHVEGKRDIESMGKVIASFPDSVRDGHHRVLASQRAGATHVPVFYHKPVKDSRGITRYPTLGEEVS